MRKELQNSGLQGKSLITAVQPAWKIKQSKREQKERVFLSVGKTERSMVRKVEGVPYKKKKKGNYIAFQIKVYMQKFWTKPECDFKQ